MKTLNSRGAIEEQGDLPGDATELKVNQGSLHAQLSHLLGDLKTIADATFTDDIQRKAIKDLLAQAVWKRYNWCLEAWGGSGRLISDGTTEIV